MSFSEFWYLYGDTVLTVFLGLVGTALTAVAGYLGTKLKDILESNKEAKQLTKIVKACVGLAERQVPKLSGTEKYQFAAAKAAEWLAAKGIVVSEAEIEIEIEEACNAFTQALLGNSSDDATSVEQTIVNEDNLEDDEEGEE